MPVAAVIGTTSAIGAGVQTIGANKALKAQQGMFNTAQQGLAPFQQAGADAIPQLQGLLQPGNQTAALSQIPGYQFALNQGLKSIDNQSSARGFGGNKVRAATDFATGSALEKSYFPTVSALQGLVNTGSGAAGNLASAAVTTGQGQAQTQASLGNAQAGALTNPYLQASLINGLSKSPGGMYGSSQPNIDQILTSGR